MIKYFLVITMAVGCGGSDYESYPPAPAPAPAPAPGGGTSSWEGLKPVINEQCALSGCHAGAPFLANGRAFKASNSKALIENGRMPLRRSPNYDVYTPQKRTALLTYLNQP